MAPILSYLHFIERETKGSEVTSLLPKVTQEVKEGGLEFQSSHT